MSQIAIVGAGHVGWHLGHHLRKAGHEVTTFSRTSTDSSLPFTDLDPRLFDFIFLCVPDDVVKVVSDQIPPSDAIVLHTSGSRPLSDLSQHTEHAVFYPMQTFTKGRNITMQDVPIFVEAPQNIKIQVIQLASGISGRVKELDSNARKELHLAAVWACNFSNHMYTIAEELLKSADLTFKDLTPLIQETLAKAVEMGPENAQTGPAIREDELTILSHLEMLGDEETKNLYRQMTSSIQKRN